MNDNKLIVPWPILTQTIHPFWKKLRKTSQLQQVTINDDFYIIDKCTFCEKNVHPSMGFCDSDHRFCEQCLKIVKYCPACAEKIYNIREFSGNVINSKTYYPCWNIYRGCNLLCDQQSIGTHEKTCIYGFIKCPFDNTKCDWLGTDMNLFDHLQEKHLISNIGNDQFDMFFYHNLKYKYFRLTGHIDNNRQGLRLYVTYIGPDEKSKKYAYNLKVHNLSIHQHHLNFNSICKSLSISQLTFESDCNELFIPFGEIHNYFSNGTFKISMAIDKIPIENRKNVNV